MFTEILGATDWDARIREVQGYTVPVANEAKLKDVAFKLFAKLPLAVGHRKAIYVNYVLMYAGLPLFPWLKNYRDTEAMNRLLEYGYANNIISRGTSFNVLDALKVAGAFLLAAGTAGVITQPLVKQTKKVAAEIASKAPSAVPSGEQVIQAQEAKQAAEQAAEIQRAGLFGMSPLMLLLFFGGGTLLYFFRQKPKTRRGRRK